MRIKASLNNVVDEKYYSVSVFDPKAALGSPKRYAYLLYGNEVKNFLNRQPWLHVENLRECIIDVSPETNKILVDLLHRLDELILDFKTAAEIVETEKDAKGGDYNSELLNLRNRLNVISKRDLRAVRDQYAYELQLGPKVWPWQY